MCILPVLESKTYFRFFKNSLITFYMKAKMFRSKLIGFWA
jgi:hypothetical protein